MMQAAATSARSAPPRLTLGIDTVSLDAARSASTGAASSKSAVDGKSFRYELQRVAQALLFDKTKHHSDQRRVCWCSRTFKGDRATVHRALDGKNARITGLMVCGDVWSCPVCSAKIAEARRQELVTGMNNHVQNGGWAYLLTLTFPHYIDHPLDELLEKQQKALTTWKSSRAYRNILGKTGSANRAGSVRSLEVTHGENGWHPHTHDLIFAKPNAFSEGDADEEGRLNSDAIEDLRKAWIAACVKHGLADQSNLQDMKARSLDVRGGKYAAEYIAKFGREAGTWGMAEELTKSHAKTGKRGGHYTPFQLLVLSMAGEDWAAALFVEFSACFVGKRMISFSPGLKKSLGLGADRSDEELANEEAQRQPEEQAGTITTDQMSVIMSRAALGEFLQYVAGMCCIPETAQADIDDFVEDLKKRPQRYSGTIRQRNMIGKGISVLHQGAIQ